MSYLVLQELTRRYGPEQGLFELSFALERGRTLSLLGPSGSGKTTTLRLLGGFERPDRGHILVAGEDVAPLGPAARRFGMVFQHYALFPHLDVGRNVGFGLESLGLGGAELERRVREALSLVDLAGFERRRIAELSGGQQQRVALARAVAPEPRVLLLDEPLSNLDPGLRERTRRELRALIQRIGITTVIVTHEQDDAFDLGDVVAVLRQGRLQQIGTPETLYRTPANPFVAGFLGRGSWIDGTVVRAPAGGWEVVVESARWPLADLPGRQPGPARLLFRPGALRLADPHPGGLAGVVVDRRFAGADCYYQVGTGGGGMLEVLGRAGAALAGQAVTLVPAAEPVDQDGVMHVFPDEPA